MGKGPLSAAIKANASKGRNDRWIDLRTRPAARSRAFSSAGSAPTVSSARCARSCDEWGHLTEKQEAAVRKIMADRKERAEKRDAERETERAAAADCPEGRITLTGVVISTDLRENQQRRPAQDAVQVGRRLQALGYGSERAVRLGRRATVATSSTPTTCRASASHSTATVTPSADDEKFAAVLQAPDNDEAEWVVIPNAPPHHHHRREDSKINVRFFLAEPAIMKDHDFATSDQWR